MYTNQILLLRKKGFRKEEEKMIKTFKRYAICFLIFSLLSCGAGFLASEKVENHYDRYDGPSQITFNRNGQTIVSDVYYPQSSDQAAEQKAEDFYENLSQGLYVLAGVCAFIGIICGLTAIVKGSSPRVEQYGVVLAKENTAYPGLIIEFNDGSRKKLFANNSLFIMQGDRGVFVCKGNTIVEFRKM